MPGPFCGLVRFMGLSTRVESYKRDSPALPLGQSLPRLSGLLGSPSILSATPSRTCTRIPQPCRHMPHVLGIHFESAGSVCAIAMEYPQMRPYGRFYVAPYAPSSDFNHGRLCVPTP